MSVEVLNNNLPSFVILILSVPAAVDRNRICPALDAFDITKPLDEPLALINPSPMAPFDTLPAKLGLLIPNSQNCVPFGVLVVNNDIPVGSVF